MIANTIKRAELFEAAEAARNRRDLATALNKYERFLKLNPAVPLAYLRMGEVLIESGDIQGAERCFLVIVTNASDQALRAEAHANLTWLYTNRDMIAQAIRHGREAIRLLPGFSGAWLNLAGAFHRGRQYREAIDCFVKAERAGSNQHYEYLYATKCLICDWTGMELLAEKIQNLPTRNVNFNFLASILSDPIAQLRAATAASERFPRSYVYPTSPRHAVAGRKIRLGYFGNEFSDTPTMRCLVATLEHHDRDAFEVHAFSFGPAHHTPFGDRVRRAVDFFHEIQDRPTDAVVRTITDHQIDILLDLCGYKKDNRMDVLARRPAPVQIGYIGWPATSGAPFIDYLIADPIVAPDPSLFTEKTIHLDCYLPTDSTRRAPTPAERTKLNLPKDAIILAAMNSSWKITPQVMRIWCNVLSAVPDAILWIAILDETVRDNLHAFAASHGVADRMITFPGAPPDQFIERVAAADLGLDTYPYNGHSTTADLLFAGVPVVTCAGTSFASRVGTSLLTAASLPQLSTSNLTDYEALIVDLCRDRPRLAALKDQLSASRSTSKLFDNLAYTKALESRFAALVQG
jgi:protein O-GlcNAc transferase